MKESPKQPVRRNFPSQKAPVNHGRVSKEDLKKPQMEPEEEDEEPEEIEILNREEEQKGSEKHLYIFQCEVWAKSVLQEMVRANQMRILDESDADDEDVYTAVLLLNLREYEMFESSGRAISTEVGVDADNTAWKISPVL